MTFYLISDNVDTLAGLRMVGVKGVVVHSPDEVKNAIEHARAKPEVGIILITPRLFKENSEMIFAYKLRGHGALILEMPDRHSGDDVAAGIRGYIQQAVGIRIDTRARQQGMDE